MVAAALLGCGLSGIPEAQAANLYWDANGTAAGTGGSGSWDTTNPFWSTTAAGTDATAVAGFTSNDAAIFTGDGGTVTLVGPITIGGLIFSAADFTVAGSTLTLDASAGSPQVSVTTGNIATVSSVIAGSGGLIKSGNGVLRLANAANSFTGTTTIAGGSLLISAASQLGADASVVVVTAGNGVPSNTALIGFTGGSLILDGTLLGFEFTRALNLEGRGPIGNNGAALLSLGNNTLSGLVTASASPQTPATFRNTRLTSVNGTLTLGGGLVVQGVAGTAFTTLGGVNQGGVSTYNLTGALAGTGTLQKVGGGVLVLSPTDTSGFSGRVRISGSAANGQSSVRVTSASVFGTANGGTTNATIDMDGGVLEVYSEAGLNFAKNVYVRSTSTFFVSNSLGGSAVNGITSFGNLSYEDGATITLGSRNGHGFGFTTAPVSGADGNSTFTNNMAGQLSFTGAFWSNGDTGAARTLLFNGNGVTTVAGGVIASGGASFDHVLTKNGTGLLSITGTNSTLDGAVNSHGGAIAITDFRSLNNSSTAAVNIGSGGTSSGLIIGTGVAATAAGLTTSRPVNLSGSTGSPSIYANQAGSNPVVFNGEFSTTAGNTTETKTLTLGGTNTADNVINTSLDNQASVTSGNLALSKIGSGTWVLAGVNTYTGLTTIVDGTLKIKANAATSTVLPAANDITFGNNNVFAGGTLEFVGQPGVNNVQTLDVLTSTSGAATIRLTPGGGGTASLTFNSQATASASASVNFVGGDFVSNKFTITGANGLLGRTYYWNGADFAYRESNVLRAPVYGTDSGFTTSATSLTASANMQVTGSFAANTISISTLKLAGSHTLTLSAGQTLTLSNGGLLVTGGDAVITGGAALALGSQALVARTNLSADTLSIQTAITGSGGLTKGGAGTLTLTAANAQTGTITINEGTIRLSGVGRLGAAAALTMRQGTVLDLNGVTPSTNTEAFNSNGSVTSATPAVFTVGANNGTGSSFGTVDGAISLTKVGTGAQSWLGSSTYTGVTTIGSTGLVTVETLADIGQNSGIGRGDAASDATNAASLVFNGSTGGISYRGDYMIGLLSLGSFSASTNRLFTLAGTGATLASSQTTNLNNAIVWRNTGAIVHGVVGPQTLVFNGSSQGDNRFNPQLTDSGTGANITAVTKTGTGVWHLGAAANTYSGPTVVTQGILGATNGQGLSSNSNLQFDGGTLYSQGTFNRNIGTGAGEMRFLAAAANTAQFSGGFLGGDAKLTVSWAGTPVWGSTAGFIDARDGLILNGSQARAQGATGSIALSEVEIAGNFSLGIATATGKTIAVTTADNSATGTVTTGDTSGLVVGQSITGPNLGSGAYITSINSATQFTMSANASTATATNRDLIANSLRAIRVDDNGNTGADFATISGIISAGDASTGIRKLGGGTLRLTGANTYQGETGVYQGALVVRSLGSSLSAASTPTSVGLSGSDVVFGNANAVTIGNGGTGGAILQYVGPGETTDRKIRINTTTGGAQLHADGAGAWVITNLANDMAAGAKTLNLRGTNAGANLITSQLSDNGGALAITIDGGAAWVLTNGANNYTGLTLVSAGALGIGHNTAVGGGIQNNNGNIFAHGADRSVANVLTLNNNSQWGFTGSHSLSFTSPVVLATSANSNNVYNSIAVGKALTFASMTANALTANRSFGVDGPGETIIAGNITTSTAFGLQIVKTGDGTLTLGGDGTVSNWNQTGTGLDLDRGVLKFSANNVINTSSAAFAGLTVTPELVDGDVATIDLNGTTQTVNGLTASANGTLRLDNTSASAGSFRFGANNSAVSFGTGVGTYVIQNTGSGALGLVKLGNTSVTFGTGVAVGNKGEIASEGGAFTIAGQVTAASGLRAIGSSTLALTGGITNPGLMRSVEVAAGSTLTLLDGAGSAFAGLTALRLGNTGTGTATLNLNVGTGATDTMTLAAGGALALGGTVTFNLTDAGLDENTTYTLLNLADGGITAFGAANMVQGAMPGGFDALTWSVTDNQVALTTGNLITGSLYWRGLTGTTWNGAANNWSTDKAGTVASTTFPGAGTDVIFAHNGATGALTTTLEQNYRVNSLTFESGTSTPSSVTINPGANASSRLEVSDFITLSAGAPASVTIGTAYKIGGPQTWTVADATTTLSLNGALLGGADVTKAGAGKLVLAAAADATFNGAQTFDLTINAGNFEVQNAGSLGSLANDNLANIIINGGAFYYANATGGTVPNPLTLAGGAISASLANHTYSGAVAITAASTINLADANGPVTNTARNISLTGALSGAGVLTVDSNSTASSGNQLGGNLTLNNAASNWTGGLVINRGTVTVGSLTSASFTGNNVTFSSFGRLIVNGVNAQSLTRSGSLTLASGAVAEFQLDNVSGTPVSAFVVNQASPTTLGSGGTGATLRTFLADSVSGLVLSGGVVLGGNSSISAGGDAAGVVNISGVISESGSGYALALNDNAGAWGTTNRTVRLGALNTFTGALSVGGGAVEFDTVSNVGGAASSLGQGSSIAMAGGVLRFIGTASQSTDRSFVFSGNGTLSAAGTGGAVLTLNGPIDVSARTADGSAFTLGGSAGSAGVINSAILMTGDAADFTVSGGNWSLRTATSRIGDDLTITGAGTVLNLDSGLLQVRDDVLVGTDAVLNLNVTGVLSFNTATLSADASVRVYTGGTVALGANNAVVATEFDGLRIGVDGAGVGTLSTGGFAQTVSEFILGNRNLDRSGVVTGAGVITVTSNIDLYAGSFAAAFAGTGALTLDKLSMNTVTLSGSAAGMTGTGATVIAEGALVLDYAGNTTTKLPVGGALDMRGGTLTLNGNGATAVAQTVASFTLGNGGSSLIGLSPVAGNGLVLNLNAITRAINAQDGTLRIVLPAGEQSPTNGVTTDTTNAIGAGAAAILGGWLTVSDGAGVFFARNATNAADGNIVAAVTSARDAVSGWVAGENVSDANGFAGTVADAAPNSLRFNAAAGSDLVLSSAGVVGVGSGGVLVTANVGGTPSIVGGTLFSGARASEVPELIFIQDSAQVFEVSADILANHALTKTGNGVLLLNGQNRYSNVTEIQAGTLRVAGGNAIGDTSVVNLSGTRASTFQLLGNETIGRLSGGSRQTDQDLGVVALGANTLTINHFSGTAATYDGIFTGSGTIIRNGTSGVGNFMLRGVSGANFTGSLVLNGGLTYLEVSGTMDAASITINRGASFLISNNGTTRSSTRLPDTVTMTLNSADGAWNGETRPSGLVIRTDQNAVTNETIGVLTFASGASYFRGDAAGTTGRSGIIAANFVRSNNATLAARARNLGLLAGNRAFLRIVSASANETAFLASLVGGGGAAASKTVSILPWAIGQTQDANVTDEIMGNTLVTYDALAGDGAGIRPLDLTSEYATFATKTANTENVRASLTADLTSLSGQTVNALVVNNANTTAGTVAVTGTGAGQTLAITSGAMLFTATGATSGTPAMGVTLGGFDGGVTVGGTNEYVVFVQNPTSAAAGGSVTATISSPLSSAADITKSGRGVLVLSAVNTAGGGARRTTVNEGVLQIGDLDNIGGNVGALVFAGGTLRLGAGFADDLSQRTVSFLQGGGTLDTNGVDITLAGALGSGAGPFTKSGLGNLTLNAAASFGGGATVASGTLTIGANDAIGVGGPLAIAGGATFALGTSSVTVSTLTTSGASPAITGAGTITASQGFSFGHTGDITVAAVLAGSQGLSKSQSSVLTLTGANTYAGTTEVTAGTLVFDSIGNIGGGASSLGAPTNAENGVIRMGLTTNGAGLRYVGTGHVTDRLIGLQGTTGTISIFANGTGALALSSGARAEMGGAKTLALRGASDPALVNSIGPIAEVGAQVTLSKSDANTWSLTAANSYSGATQVDEGTLRFTAPGALPAASSLRLGAAGTAGTAEILGHDQTTGGLNVQSTLLATVNTLRVETGRTLTLTGAVTLGSATSGTTTVLQTSGGGHLAVSNPASTGTTFRAGGHEANLLTADLTGLASLTVDLHPVSGVFQVSSASGTNSTGYAVLSLPNAATVTAGALTVGGGGSYNGNPGQVNQLRLGAGVTSLRVGSLNIGTGSRDLGSLVFAGAGGSLEVRAADGVSATPFNMATGSANTAVVLSTNQNTFDVTGHQASLKFGAVNIGTQNRNAGLLNVFSFDTGTLEIESLNASAKGANGNTTSTVINLGGGTVTTGAWTLASTTGNGVAEATANLTGGTITFSGDILRGTDSVGGGTATGTVNLNGAALRMAGFAIGSASNPITFNAQAGSLRDVGTLNGSGGLTKSGAGTLTLEGAAAFTGTTAVTGGTLVLAGTSLVSQSVVINGGTGSTLRVTSSAALGSVATLNAATGAVAPVFQFAIDGGGAIALPVSFIGNSSITSTIHVSNNGTGTNGVVRLNGAGGSGYGNATLNVTGADGYSLYVANLINSAGALGTMTFNPTSAALELGNLTVGRNTGIGVFALGGTHAGSKVSGVIADGSGANVGGLAAVSKTGTGTWTLTGANTYTGATMVSAGSLVAGVGALAGTSALTVTGGSLTAVDFGATPTITVGAAGTAVFSGTGLTAGAVTVDNTADDALHFSGATGTVTLASLGGAGKARFASNLSIGTVNGGTTTVGGVATVTTLTSGTLTLNGATASIGTLNGGTVNLGTTALTVNDGTFGGLLAGASGSLIKASAGTLTITSANTFGGGTTVSAGTMTLGNVAALGTGAVTVAAGATLNLNNLGVSNAITVATGATITGGPDVANTPTTGTTAITTVLTGTGGLEKADGGELTLTTPNFFTGPVEANVAGAVIKAAFLDDNSSSLGASALNQPSNLVLGSGATLEFTGTSSAVTSRSFTIGGSAGISATGTGTLEFTSASQIATTGSAPALTLTANNSGTNRFAASLADGSTALANLAINGTGVWVIGSGANRFKSDVRIDAGSGATVGLESGSLPTGAVLAVGNNATVRWEAGNTTPVGLEVAAGTTAKLDLGANTVVFTAAPVVTGTGSSTLEKQGSGTLRIANGVSAPSVNVAVSSGTLAVNGVLGNVTLSSGARLGGTGTLGAVTTSSGSTIAPGNSPGVMNTSSMTLVGNTTFLWEVQDAQAGPGVGGYDKTVISGSLDLTGASAGNRIILKINSLASDGVTIGNATNFGPPNGVASIRTFEFASVQTGSSGVLLGNGLNISDVFQFDVSQFTYSDGSTSNAGLWSIDWNQGTGAITLTAVPEPSTYGFGLGALALAAAAIRRRKRQATKA